MINKPLTEKDIEMMDYFHISIVQSAKRLLKQGINSRIGSLFRQIRLKKICEPDAEIAIGILKEVRDEMIDACFQIDDGDDKE